MPQVSTERNLAGLEGHLLVATPGLRENPFARSVVYIYSDNPNGTVGVTVNRPSSQITFPEVLSQHNIVSEPPLSTPSMREAIRILDGGPIAKSMGLIVHSMDYCSPTHTVSVGGGVVGVTATLDILKAIAAGKGPANAVMTLGYMGWMPGRLTTELKGNYWLTCPFDVDLIFDENNDSKYERALKKIGVNAASLSLYFGNA